MLQLVDFSYNPAFHSKKTQVSFMSDDFLDMNLT